MCMLAFVSHLSCKLSCLLSEGVRRRRLHGDFGSPDLQHLKLLRQADTNTHFQCTASAHSRKHNIRISRVFLGEEKEKLYRGHMICISPCEQSIDFAAGATEVSAPPSGPHLKFAAAVLLLFSASPPHWLFPHPSGTERHRVKGQTEHSRVQKLCK